MLYRLSIISSIMLSIALFVLAQQPKDEIRELIAQYNFDPQLIKVINHKCSSYELKK